jgi:hypothetical protein
MSHFWFFRRRIALRFKRVFVPLLPSEKRTLIDGGQLMALSGAFRATAACDRETAGASFTPNRLILCPARNEFPTPWEEKTEPSDGPVRSHKSRSVVTRDTRPTPAAIPKPASRIDERTRGSDRRLGRRDRDIDCNNAELVRIYIARDSEFFPHARPSGAEGRTRPIDRMHAPARCISRAIYCPRPNFQGG